jgi:putative flippase GtrA
VTRASLVLRYGAFAVLATIANLGTQRLILGHGDWAGRYILAVIAGTAVGLVAKYILDKKWIFASAERGLAAEGQQFMLYSVTGVFTTLVFWGFETVFWLVGQTHMAREIGAVLGLAIGYVAKYQLDRRYVFARAQDMAA